MPHQIEGFWNKPLSRKARRVAVSLLFIAGVVGEAWLGRRRLFVTHDRPYLVAFALFVACLAGLLISTIAIARTVRPIDRRMWTGVLTCLAFSLIGVFGDYTVSNLTAVGIIGSVVTGAILGALNAAQTRDSGTEPVLQ